MARGEVAVLAALGSRAVRGRGLGIGTSRRCRESSSSDGGSVNATEEEADSASLSIPVIIGFRTAARTGREGSGPDSPSNSLESSGALCMVLSIRHVGHEVTLAYPSVKFRGQG